MLISFLSNFTSYIHTHRFNGHFPGKPGLAGRPLDSQSPKHPYPEHPYRTGQNSVPTGYFGVPHPPTLTTIPWGFEAEDFTGRMPFLSPNNIIKALKVKININTHTPYNCRRIHNDVKIFKHI